MHIYTKYENNFWGPDIKCNFENYIPEQLTKTDSSDCMITNEITYIWNKELKNENLFW